MVTGILGYRDTGNRIQGYRKQDTGGYRKQDTGIQGFWI